VPSAPCAFREKRIGRLRAAMELKWAQNLPDFATAENRTGPPLRLRRVVARGSLLETVRTPGLADLNLRPRWNAHQAIGRAAAFARFIVPKQSLAGRCSEAHADDDILAAAVHPTAVGLGPRRDCRRSQGRRPANSLRDRSLVHRGLMHHSLGRGGLMRHRRRHRGLRPLGPLGPRSGRRHRDWRRPKFLDGLQDRRSRLDQLRARKSGQPNDSSQSSDSGKQPGRQNESA
jgi:hypothetical protein